MHLCRFVEPGPKYSIKQVTPGANLPEILDIIHSSFLTVARDMDLTQENCPAHSAFMPIEKLIDLSSRAAFFGLYADGKLAGFAAAEKVGDGEVYYLDRLAVVPEMRHRGYGARLVKHVLEYVKGQGGKKVSLGMIDSLTVLKEWYISLGFREMATQKFEHLPFLVRFMDIDLPAR